MALGFGLLLRALLGGPRRVALWASAHPVRTAGGVAALVAAWVMLASVSPGAGLVPDPAGVTLGRLRRFSLAHPAYPVAIVFGGGALLLLR
jgi:hypothetical protein